MRAIVEEKSVGVPHPAFATMHAHLIGDPDLAAVAPHRLLSLYPVSLASYAPFFRRFYMAQEQTSALYYKTPGWDLSGCLSNVQLVMVTFEGYSEEDHDSYNAIFREDIPKDLMALSDEIIAHANSTAKGEIVHGGYDLIRLQMWPLLKAMWLMQRWDAVAFEGKLREDSKAGWISGMRKTAHFYGIELDDNLLV